VPNTPGPQSLPFPRSFLLAQSRQRLTATAKQGKTAAKTMTSASSASPNESGGRFRNRRKTSNSLIELDDVDLSRQVRRDFEANFLLANRRLHPGLHGSSPWVFGGVRVRLSDGRDTTWTALNSPIVFSAITYK